MDTNLLRKALGKQLTSLKRAEAAMKEVGALPDDLAPVLYRAAELADELAGAARELDPSPLRTELERVYSALSQRTQGALADASAKLAVGVASELGKDAPVTGQLPDLKWGLLRLEFKLGSGKREVAIWYGPKIAKLASAPPVVAELVAAARQARASLDASPLDADAFVAEVSRAYEDARRRANALPQAPVPLLQVLRELVIARQPSAFLADPLSENFESRYGRVQFSYDLFRAGPRGGLSLGVAAHAQTKRPEDHLWVPTSHGGDGTHFASLAWRKKD